MSKFLEAKNKSQAALDNFKKTLKECSEGYDFKGLVTYREISNLPIADGTPLKGRNGAEIFSPKLHSDEYGEVFLTVISPGDEFEEQWHDCIEGGVVIYGELADHEQSKVYKRHDVFTYSPLKKHRPFNPSKTTPTKLCVWFHNPKKK
ncbi:MAG: hypothetical protein ACRBFS_22915 [Aureispira sp.]